ncbi:MAG: hypothetical protein K0U37_09650 [Gammaproteobacteria bacterium]|nr:hypothetical protein [Gammaproteobacteria bacterium]
MTHEPSEGQKRKNESRQRLQDELNIHYNQEPKKQTVADSPIVVNVKEKDDAALTAAVKAYNDLFLKPDGTYKDGYEAPKTDKNGATTYKFPSEKEAVNFFSDRAKQGEAFKVYDARTNKMVAFSKGDGHLRRPPEPDGDIIRKGEKFSDPNNNAPANISPQ